VDSREGGDGVPRRCGALDREIVRRVTVPMAPGFMAWFYMRSKLSVVVADLAQETRFVPCELLLKHGLKSGIAVPIAGKPRPFGVLEANARQQRIFRDDEVNFVWSVANMPATVIEQRRAAAELHEKCEQLQALSRKLIEAQGAERRAVARELHDDSARSSPPSSSTSSKMSATRRRASPWSMAQSRGCGIWRTTCVPPCSTSCGSQPRCAGTWSKRFSSVRAPISPCAGRSR